MSRIAVRVFVTATSLSHLFAIYLKINQCAASSYFNHTIHIYIDNIIKVRTHPVLHVYTSKYTITAPKCTQPWWACLLLIMAPGTSKTLERRRTKKPEGGTSIPSVPVTTMYIETRIIRSNITPQRTTTFRTTTDYRRVGRDRLFAHK